MRFERKSISEENAIRNISKYLSLNIFGNFNKSQKKFQSKLGSNRFQINRIFFISTFPPMNKHSHFQYHRTLQNAEERKNERASNMKQNTYRFFMFVNRFALFSMSICLAFRILYSDLRHSFACNVYLSIPEWIEEKKESRRICICMRIETE